MEAKRDDRLRIGGGSYMTEETSVAEVLPGQTDIYEFLEERNGKHWTEDEDRFLNENAGVMTAKEIAKVLNRTETSVYKRANLLFIAFRKDSIYTLYDKGMPVFQGNLEECAEFWKVTVSTIRFYATKSHLNRIEEESPYPDHRRLAVRM